MVGFTRTKSPEFRGIKCFHITPAYRFNIITIKSPVSQAELKEIGATHNYPMPLAKVKCGEGHLGNPVAQKIQSKTTVKRQEWTSIDGFGIGRHHSYSGHNPTSVPDARPANKNVPASPCLPSLKKDHSFSTLSFSEFCGEALHSALPLHI